MRNLTIRDYVILSVAFGIGWLVACSTNVMGDTVKRTVITETTVSVPNVEVIMTPVRVMRPRTWSISRTVRTTERQLVAEGLAMPRVTYEKREVPAYTVVESPREPFVRGGLFRDRVIQPRRTQLTIEY